MTTTFLKDNYDHFLKFIKTNSKYSNFLFLTDGSKDSKDIERFVKESLKTDGDCAATIANRAKKHTGKYSFDDVTQLVNDCADHYKTQFSLEKTTVNDLVIGHKYKRILINVIANNFDSGSGMFLGNDDVNGNLLVCIGNQKDDNKYRFWQEGDLYYFECQQKKNKIVQKYLDWAKRSKKDINKTILLFLGQKDHFFKYLGEFYCVDLFFDKKNNINHAFLILKSKIQDKLDQIAESEQSNLENESKEAEQLSDEELERRAREASEKNKQKGSNKRKTVSNQYIRNKYIEKHVIRSAHGICARCGRKVGQGDNDIPELQCHHIIPLSADGKDIIENCEALCPNCHRYKHKYELKKE